MVKKSPGHIEQLPSGSWRVKVYGGTDPLTGRPAVLRAADEPRFAERRERPALGVTMTAEFQLVIDCADPEPLARFWVAALGYQFEPPPDGYDNWDD
jgi:hypothetical protein